MSLNRKKNCGNETIVCSQYFLRSSCSQILFREDVLKNFINVTGIHVCIKKRLQHRCFQVKSEKFLRTSFFTEHLRWLLLKPNMYMLQLRIYYILEQKISTGANANIAKTKREKQIVFVVERWIQYLLPRLKSRSAREASLHAAFMANCRTGSQTC